MTFQCIYIKFGKNVQYIPVVLEKHAFIFLWIIQNLSFLVVLPWKPVSLLPTWAELEVTRPIAFQKLVSKILVTLLYCTKPSPNLNYYPSMFDNWFVEEFERTLNLALVCSSVCSSFRPFATPFLEIRSLLFSEIWQLDRTCIGDKNFPSGFLAKILISSNSL